MISAKNIRRNYNDLQVLKGVDLEIEQGEIISIVGASGAGKTTLLQILGTLDLADSGDIKFKDVAVGKPDHDRLIHAKGIKRLVNFVIDTAIVFGIWFGIWTILQPMLPLQRWAYEPDNYKIITTVLGSYVLIHTIYYFLFEYLTSRTLGKLLTGTKTILTTGKKPTATAVLVRTLSRLIPFEHLTFKVRELTPEAEARLDKNYKTWLGRTMRKRAMLQSPFAGKDVRGAKPQNGLHDGMSNTIVIDTRRAGFDLDNLSYDQLGEDGLSQFRNEQIGFVFQFHHLLPEFNALENVCIPAYIGGMGKAEAEVRGTELLTFLGLGERMDHKPNELSGGEQQRVAVARALMNRPSAILADEPSGNLDSKSAKELHKLFFDLRDQFNQTFIIVTHNDELAEMADRKLTMKDGVILSEESK
jgi:lipoprotein-releasing system ATP-binding protein